MIDQEKAAHDPLWMTNEAIVRFAESVVARPEEWAWTPYGKDLAVAVIALAKERDSWRTLAEGWKKCDDRRSHSAM